MIAYVLGVVALWGVVLPAILIADAGGSMLPWRGVLPAAAAVLLAAAGTALVDAGARTLAAQDVGLFGVVPGERLVRTGIYARIRNPIDLGTVAISLASWLAFAVDLMWVITAGAIAYFVGGVGPYEDRRLLEEFGDDFRDYRAAVAKWAPRRRP